MRLLKKLPKHDIRCTIRASSEDEWYDMLKDNYYTEPTEVDQLVFEKLVPQDHFVRRAKRVIDFERFRDQLRDCYSPDMGRTAEDPVRMLKLQLLQFQYQLSDREVIRQIQVNGAFRFFLDLSLDSKLPVPSLLSQFRTRLGEAHHKAVFEEVLRQAREQGLVKDRLRLKDATHIIANIAIPATIGLVAQARERLLARARPYRPELVAYEHAEAERIRLSTSDLKEAERLLHRVEQLRRIVAWAEALKEELGPVPEDPDGGRKRFEEAVELAHKLLSDQDHPDEGDRVRSAVDPEARMGKHGSYYDGYLLDISLDAHSELITALNVVAANGKEAEDAISLIAAEEKAYGNDILEVSLDGIGFNGKVLRQLSGGLGLEVYLPPQARPSAGAYFSPAQFRLDEMAEVLSCPGGQKTRRYRNQQDTGWQYFFARSQCKDCPLLGKCMKALPKTTGRGVLKNDFEAEYAAALARSETERYAAVRAEHPKVERKLGKLVHTHRGRRSRYWGRWRVGVQCLLLGMVVNIKRMVKHLCPKLGVLHARWLKSEVLRWKGLGMSAPR
jgi:transposase